MKRLPNKSENNLYLGHADNAGKAFVRYPQQQNRILKSREYVLQALNLAYSDGIATPFITEIGCAALDISGPFSVKTNVTGCDFRPESVARAKQRYPLSFPMQYDLNLKDFLVSGDILVACEILEHLQKPKKLMKRLMERFRYAVISHPIHEPPNFQNKEHMWSFSLADLESWFIDNGYSILRLEFVLNRLLKIEEINSAQTFLNNRTWIIGLALGKRIEN